MIAQNLCSKKAYIKRKIDVKSTKCRDFARILTIFPPNSYNRLNIIVKTSQRRYLTAILREKKFCGKKAPAPAYKAVYGDFAPRLFFFRVKTSSLFVGMTLILIRRKKNKNFLLCSLHLHQVSPGGKRKLHMYTICVSKIAVL